LRTRIALATYDRAPSLAPDDQLLLPEFAALGIDAEPAVWSSEEVIWETFDAVVIRSCWDYHLRVAAFREWLARLDASRLPVWNSVGLVEWNSHKNYLIDLERRGVTIVPTRLIGEGGSAAIEAVVRDAGWSRFVLKPAVSASGFETHAFDADFGAETRQAIDRVTRLGDVLVQPFLEEVPARGEHSLIYFEGKFSHAAIKRAAASDFRVQTEHGGSVTPVLVDQWLVDAGMKALKALPDMPLYARVDGVARNDEFLLMELELIEPNLFFELQPGSAAAFASAVATVLAG
jgi:glutathione synthase/RimK-type ligase-like ATP-grasp enzyme